MKKVALAIFYSITLFILIFSLLSIFHVSLFGINFFKVVSGSMEPNLKINDVIIVKKTNDLNVDDIITYKDKSGQYVTHRIVEINDNNIITKGDANNTNDNPITYDDVVGKLVYKTKIIGFLNYMFSTPVSWVLLLVVGITITIMIPDKKSQ